VREDGVRGGDGCEVQAPGRSEESALTLEPAHVPSGTGPIPFLTASYIEAADDLSTDSFNMSPQPPLCVTYAPRSYGCGSSGQSGNP
jgi:hypothetical protein